MADTPSNARPFLPFANGPQNRLRQKVRGGGAKPRENAAEHGQELLRQIEGFQREVDIYTAGRPQNLPALPDEVQVIIESKRLLPEQVKSLGLTPIAERDDGLLVTISPDVALPALVSKAQSYISETTGSGNPRFGGVLAPIEHIRPATRADKAGARLAALLAAGLLDPTQPIWVDIELAGGQNDAGVKHRQEFNDYLNNFSGELPALAEDVVTATGNFLVEADYSLHRVLLPGRAVLDLLDNSRASWILTIDLLPEIEDHTISLPALAAGPLPPIPTLPANAPRLVIVDSGIAANHPLFTDATGRTIIGRQQNFLPPTSETANLTTDEIDGGHGTAIASIVAYGALPGDATSPVFWLENAKFLLPATKLNPDSPNDAPQSHPQQFYKSLMRQVVEAFHNPMPQLCKIFTLAVGSTPNPKRTFSNWAEELDNLAATNDLLFVVPTGNLHPAEIAELMAANVTYPDYLLDPHAALRVPGPAHHALTVGAITPDAPRQHAQDIAPPQYPAPFSRSGLPQSGPVKPDVVEVGGNLTRAFTATPAGAVPVANRNFATGQADQPLGWHYGTGLAAAKISHLAGQIQAQHPAASANLIRALIVNSAEWPAAFARSLALDKEGTLSKDGCRMLLQLCGYGVPQPDKALSSNAHCMVFVTEDVFTWNKADKNSSGRYPAKVSFFSVKLEPDDLFRLPAAARVRVSVTLAYNPPVRKTQRRRYQAIDMRWELKRRDEASADFYARWMREANGDEDTDDAETTATPLTPWPWQLKPTLNPGSRTRRGSLIRDWLDISVHDLPDTLELVALAMVAPWRRPPEPLRQPFALVVSIEALDHRLPIYDAVRVQTTPAE